jgi:ankyrin repeat protein
MEASKNVFDLCFSEQDKSVGLEAFFEKHPDADVNLYQDAPGARSIHFAAYRGHVACLRLLIEANADLDVRDNEGNTALLFASNEDNLECAQVLIDNKADVNAAANNGTTPGHGAAHMGHSKCLDLLINAKADVSARTVDGGSNISNNPNITH